VRGRERVEAEEARAATARFCGGGGRLWAAAVVDLSKRHLPPAEIVVGTWRAARAEQDDLTEDELGSAH
jgi:hypothetical protein